MRRLLYVAPVLALSLLAGCSSDGESTASDPAVTASANSGTPLEPSDFTAPTAETDPVATVSQAPATEMPVPVFDGDQVTGMTWNGVPERDNNGDVLITYLAKGTGVELTADSTVKAHYYGTLPGEKSEFDSSFKHGDDPIEFSLNGVIQGWANGLTGVPVGSKVILGIPSRYAYGETGSGDSIPANAYLYFYVDVVDGSIPKDYGFAEPTAATDKVATVTEAPADQMPQPVLDGDQVTGMTWDGVPERDNNGDVLITYLIKGDGEKLTAKSTVNAQYYGTLPTDEEPFDSSFANGGEPIEFGLDGVIQGWTNGLTGVPVGSKVILGIPSRYAYGTAGGGGVIPPNAYLYFYVDVVSAS